VSKKRGGQPRPKIVTKNEGARRGVRANEYWGEVDRLGRSKKTPCGLGKNLWGQGSGVGEASSERKIRGS